MVDRILEERRARLALPFMTGTRPWPAAGGADDEDADGFQGTLDALAYVGHVRRFSDVGCDLLPDIVRALVKGARFSQREVEFFGALEELLIRGRLVVTPPAAVG